MGLGKKILKTSPVGYAAVKAVERRNDPEVQVTREAKRAGNDGLAKHGKRQVHVEKKAQLEAERGKVVAKFSPGMTAIRLYANGDSVSSMHGSGSAIGAMARVDQSGAKHVIRATRQ